MATISKLVPGQVLWSVVKGQMGNTTRVVGRLFEVRIIAIDPDGKWVEASRNGNPPRKYQDNNVRNWKVKKPEPKGEVFGMATY